MDFGFTYGLLGVLLQHVYFAVFGASHWPTFGLLVVYLISMLVFWSLLCRDFGESLTTFSVLAGLSSMIIYIEPWPPTAAHVLMELSLAFSLYFTLKRRFALALSIAALGALAMPSLPIVLAALLTLIIIWVWWGTPGRRMGALLTQLAPATIAYTAAVVVMTGFFGWRSVLPSLIPLRGAAVYRALNYGFFARGRSLWYPPHPHIGHYLYTSAGIWLLCSALLVIFGCAAAVQIVRSGRPAPHALFILVCCALHLAFVFAAFGNPESIAYYSLVLSAGVLAGVSDLTNKRLRIAIGSLLLVLGLLSQRDETRAGLKMWKSGSVSRETASLYAPDGFPPEWRSVLSLAKKRRVFLLAYGTGVGLYYPQIGTAQSWLLIPGVPLPRERSFVLRQIRQADVVVEKLVDDSMYDKEWRAALEDFPLKVLGSYFLIRTKDQTDRAELLQTTTFRSD